MRVRRPTANSTFCIHIHNIRRCWSDMGARILSCLPFASLVIPTNQMRITLGTVCTYAQREGLRPKRGTSFVQAHTRLIKVSSQYQLDGTSWTPGHPCKNLSSHSYFLHTITPLFPRNVVLRPPRGGIGAHPSPDRHRIPNHLRTTRPVMNGDEVVGGRRGRVCNNKVISFLFS